MARSGQRIDELRRLIQVLRYEKAASYLEIGVRHGGTFLQVMSSLPMGSRGVAVDLPGARWGCEGSRESLEQVVAKLQRQGYDIKTIWGDSRAPDTVAEVVRYGPYDACLIDADHTYEAVRDDWTNYGRMARIVALHDIDGDGKVEVPRLWAEIKPSYRHEEIIGAQRGMGIGVVYR